MPTRPTNDAKPPRQALQPMPPRRDGWDENYKIPKPAEKTELERLEAHVSNLALMRTREADCCHTFYDVLSYDPATRIARIQRAGMLQNPVYDVNTATLECTCPDCQITIPKWNRKLAAAGLPASLTCKHPIILQTKCIADPTLLRRVTIWTTPAAAATAPAQPRPRPTADQLKRDFD